MLALYAKRHYTRFFISELDLNNVNNIKVTYGNAVKRLDKIKSHNTSPLKNKFILEVKKTNKTS